MRKKKKKLRRTKKRMRVKDYLKQLHKKVKSPKICFVCGKPIKYDYQARYIGRDCKGRIYEDKRELWCHRKRGCRPGGYYYMRNKLLGPDFKKRFMEKGNKSW